MSFQAGTVYDLGSTQGSTMLSGLIRRYLLTMLTFAGGIWASLFTGDWDWFARSGSAVVALGVVLTSHQVLEHYHHLRVAQELCARRGLPTLGPARDRDWASDNSMRELIRSRRHEEDLWAEEFFGLRILVVGTLVWGFGDLLGLLL